MAQTIVLITGAKRGLGKALVQRFLALPNHTVIALNRSSSSPPSQSLTSLPKGPNSTLITIAYDARSEESPFAAVEELKSKHGITHLDIVVANAAIATHYPLARDAKKKDIIEHVEVNACAVISLFQATRDLMMKAAAERGGSGKPIFAPMGSGAGALGRQPAVPNSVYGPSKAMVFWYGVRINAEEDWLSAFVIDPGWVQTEMGNAAARDFGMDKATLLVDEAMDGVFNVLRTATKEKYGGKAVLYNGEVQEW